MFTRAFWVNMGVYFLLLVAAIYALFAYLDSYTLHGEEIKVPDLRGYHISEVENLLESNSLQHVIMDSIFVENEDGGMVMEQIPDSGFMVKKDRKIYLTVSSYQAPKIPLPNLKYDDKRNVIAQLSSMGFKIDSIRYVPSECEDCLEFVEIDNEMVEPGDRLDIGSALVLVFGGGAGDQFVAIPNLLGLGMYEANEMVINAGLKVSVMVPDKEFSPEDSILGFVYRQIPEPSYEPTAYLGTSIQLFVTTDDNKRPELAIDTIPENSQPE